MIKESNHRYVVEKDAECGCWMIYDMANNRIIDHYGQTLYAWTQAVGIAIQLNKEEYYYGRPQR